MDVVNQRDRIKRTSLLLAAAFALTGCRPPDAKIQPAENGTKPDPAVSIPAKPRLVPVPPRHATPRHTTIGTSVEGRSIECVEFGDGEDVVLIMASIHGNEPAGTPLVRKLVAYLVDRPDLLEGRRLLLLPAANPDGLARGTRHNTRGVDLNRNFPASNYQAAAKHGAAPLSEPESRAFHQFLLKNRPRRIVSLHQPVNYGSPCIDYDGPAEGLARAMAAHGDLPIKRLGGREGSLGSYAGDSLGIPIITVELPKAASQMSAEELWAKYGKMLLAAISYPGLVRGDIRTERATSVEP